MFFVRNLQDRMLQQKVEDDNIPRVGGARWKSAREDKGTIRSYAKDVQEKTRKSAKSGKQNINLLTGKPMFSKTSPLDASAASLSNNNTSVKIDYMNNISASQGQSEENHQHENSGSGDEACVYGYQQTGKMEPLTLFLSIKI